MKVPPFSLEKQLSSIGPELDAALLRVLRSGQYIGGAEVNGFEKSFAESIGVPHVVGCNSGTDALVIALRALGIGQGDEVITSSFSFFATAEAISSVGAKPVFVDVVQNNYLIDFAEIEKAITRSTKAILPVHLFGCPVNMEQLMSLARARGLHVIEDCAQASGSEWNGRPVGSWGDVGCFSFFPTKNLGAAGDGGAISTKDPDLSQRMRELAVHGMPRRYVHTELGYNSRLDALQAAILNVKLPKLSSWVEKRNSIAMRYLELLQGLTGLELPCSSVEGNLVHGWNQFVVQVSNSLRLNQDPDEPHQTPRDILKKRLEEKGIDTIIYYPIPIHLQPAYKNLGYSLGSLPITENLCSEVLSLPIFPELSIHQQNYVVESIRDLLC